MPTGGSALDAAAAMLLQHADRLKPEASATVRATVPARAWQPPDPTVDRFGCFTRMLIGPAADRLPSDGPLTGVAFAVKDLFDVAGLPTTAGAGLRRDVAPASRDAVVVERLEAAGAVLVGTCNMDEFAYGFSTVNAAFGTTRNPHDPDRLAGGSSGGSAAAVAAELVPLALGSDTNGSIRVPASLCGVYGLRPTHGVLPMAGVFPFVDALDVPGPLAASLDLLRLSFEAMVGSRIKPVDVGALRIARLGGWFVANAGPDANAETERVCRQIGVDATVDWPEAERARSAAYILTAAEGGARHLPELEVRPEAFDAAVRDRLLAGAAMPASALIAAQRFANRYAATMARFWEEVDVVIAPATPVTAPRVEEKTIEIGGSLMAARANLGILTQPVSLAGCPVLAAPLLRAGRLPLGLQLIAAPGREDRLFALAGRLEEQGLTGFVAAGAA